MSGYFPDEFIEQIRSQADIVEVIGQYVSLKKRGRNWFGLCPFHSERTPSFSVNPELGIFKCYGCSKGGDVYTFLMEYEKLTFAQCVELLADRLGLKVPRRQKGDGQQESWDKLVYANRFARDYYHRLLTGDRGRPALDYLNSRGLDGETIREFELGWATAEREGLKKAALEHGIDEETLLDAGLVSRSEESGESFDRFRSRVMIPIINPAGSVIGFGGRLLAEGEPKYLNTSDTVLFHKGEVLFGLHKSRGAIRRDSRAVVVEGYMDLISLYRHGFHPVVAPMGTALTPGQAKLLGRYTRDVFLLYDADKAGLRATFRGGDELLAAGLSVRVATLPEGMDPDDFIRSKGREAFESLLGSAVDFLDRKMELLVSRTDLTVTANRQRAADKLLESVARCRDDLTRNLYLKKAAEFIGVPQSVLAERLSRLLRLQTARRPGAAPGRQAAGTSAGKKAEFYLVALCLRFPDYVDKTIEKLGDTPFTVPDYRQIFQALTEARSSGTKNPVEYVYEKLPENLQTLVGQLLSEKEKVEPADEVFNSCWRRIKIELLDKQLEDNRSKIGELKDAGLMSTQVSLDKERKKLQQELHGGFFTSKS
ncbi:MAG: DNA primase [Candidatus Glassbacteria bacterium]|nr:DNA primase [Candidatus Glassbacteria bacterium]